MDGNLRYTGKTFSFQHGVHPEEYKYLTDRKPIRRMPFVDEYILTLGQHIGAPSKPVVKRGDKVKRGQKIAESAGFVSVDLHSPVDGTVMDIGLYDTPKGEVKPSIKIKTDVYSPQLWEDKPVDPESLDAKEFIRAVQEAGIVGLGGAAFPSHVKFSIPEGKTCKYIMLNGCECEPYLTADHRTMVEYPESIIDGLEILNRFIQANRAFIGIEANKPDAIKALRALAAESNLPIEVVALDVKYPQGAEKMMISAILGEEVPTGKLPLDLGVLVANVGTIKAISDYFRKGMPLIERIVTVTGTAVKDPVNVLVPIGTPMHEVIEFCGGISDNAARMLLGGPMMGAVQKTLDVPVLKGTSGILIMAENEIVEFEEYNCIRCGRCVEACPMFLNPSMMGLLAKKGLWEDMQDFHVMDCFECASCSYVCPSGIPLVQSFRVAKGILREKAIREKQKEQV